MTFDRSKCWRCGELTSVRRRVLKLSALCVALSIPACAQNRAKVTVDFGKKVNVLTDTSLGVPAVTSAGNNFDQANVPSLRAAGITTVRFPGSHGVPDVYHWSTRKLIRYAGDAGYADDKSNVGTLALLAEKLGQGFCVVNYGSNQNGSGGGEPAEAAALVAYINGSPTDTRVLGVDSIGEDWRTVGDWARLRGEAPLPNDDGRNFLRIQHPAPFGFKLWQVGDAVYNNGYYGGDHTGNPDLHGPNPGGPKDLAKLKGSPKLSPASYAENFKKYVKAMKDVDPAIQIGAGLVLPPNPSPNSHDWAPDWNDAVLKGACADLDFVTFDWGLQPLLPPNWNTLDEASLLANQGYNQTNVIVQLVSRILDDYKRSCPAGHAPRVAFAPVGIATWPKVEHPGVKALWVADFYAMLIESGSANINWNEMYGDSMLSADRKTFGPVFYGLQMLHTVLHNPGDELVETRSSSQMVAAHAVTRRDGYVGLMLINKDPHNQATVTVTIKNGNIGSAGRRIDFTGSQPAAAAKPAVSPFSAPGSEFTVTVPPYTITDILLPAAK